MAKQVIDVKEGRILEGRPYRNKGTMTWLVQDMNRYNAMPGVTAKLWGLMRDGKYIVQLVALEEV